MLRSLSLYDFKSFERATLDASGFTLLIGSNASGKSNLREALRVLNGIAQGFSLSEVLGGVWRQGDEKEWDGIRGGALGAPRSGKNKFTLAVSLEVDVPKSTDAAKPRNLVSRTAEYLIEIDLNARRQPVVAREELSVGQYGFLTHIDGNPRPGGTDRIIAARIRKGTGGMPPDERFVSDRAILSQVRDSQHATPAMRREVGAVIDALNSMRFLDLQPEPARTPSPSGVRVLGDNGQNLSSVLENLVADEQNGEILASWIKTLTPMDATGITFHHELDGRVLAVLEEENGQRTPLTQASDGTVRFLAILALMLSSRSPSTIILEEIENGIHPHRVGLLLELIETAVKYHGIQVIATSHSPALLASIWDSQDARPILVSRFRDSNSMLTNLQDNSDFSPEATGESPSTLMEAGWFEDTAEFVLDDTPEENGDAK